jgi:hypothetical protein
MKLDGVAELVNKLANDIVYQDTGRENFSKNVRKNYPPLGKLGLSKYKHVVSWKEKDYNCIYVSNDDIVLIEWSQRRPYGWKVAEETCVHHSHEDWKGDDRDA